MFELLAIWNGLRTLVSLIVLITFLATGYKD